MKDWLDRKTLNLLETKMLFQVNYKYVNPTNGKLRNAALAIEAKDTAEARKVGITQIKMEFDHFEITSIKTFGTNSK